MAVYKLSKAKAKYAKALHSYEERLAAFEAKKSEWISILESLRSKVIEEGVYVSSAGVSSRDIRRFNVCAVFPSVHRLINWDMKAADGCMLGVYRSEVDDYNKEGFYAIPVTPELRELICRFEAIEQELVDEDSNLELAAQKLRKKKEDIFRATIDLPEGVNAFATDDPTDFKVVLTSDKSWHPASEGDNMTIGRVVDLEGKSDEANSLLVKQVCDLILSLDKITGSCVIE